MTAFRPTDEQRRAIDHGLVDACVMAGAGSGKTAVLTHRFLRLVRHHGLEVRRIAALTFTDKAAGEMRERIARALDAAGLEDERDEVEFAPISTIHAYCARLLRMHAVEAGLDPAFTVLDEIESALLREEAFELARHALVAEGSRARAVLQRIGAEAKDVAGLYERIRGAGLDPAALTWCVSEVDRDAVRRDARDALHDMLEAGASVPELGPRLDAARAEVETLLDAADATPWRWYATCDQVQRVAPDGRARGPRPFQQARKTLAGHLERLGDAALDDLGASEIAPDLAALLAQYDRTYTLLKDDRAALDFTDLELRASALLEDLAAKGRTPAGRPLALLVDEYQDTNPLQARILALLRATTTPFFAVGDPKQSIYRFRRADVGVIQREWDDVGTAGQHLLRATFRARPPLVDVLNGIHERLFDGGAAGVDHQALDAKGAFRDVPGPEVEVAIVDGGAGSRITVGRAGEARWIAARIQALVEGGTPRARIEVDQDGEERPPRTLGYGDVAILLRARTSLWIYEDALAAAGVPFQTQKGRGYFQADEIVDLVNALRVVQDPADDHALACLLTSPMVGAGDEDLLRLFPGRRAEPGTAWAAFEAAAADDPSGRYAVVWRRLEHLRREALAGRLAAVVEGVLRDLGLLEAALLQDEGARAAANLRKAVQVARDLEGTGRHDLGDLLRHLETLRDREVPEAEAVFGVEGADAVQIITVHGAKGLEYPVVFLADIGRRPPAYSEALPFEPGEGVTATIRHPVEWKAFKPGGYERLKQIETTRQAQESRRLLYVAMTRAEERLYLTGACKGRNRDGTLKEFGEWGPAVLDAIGVDPSATPEVRTYGSGTLEIAVVEPPEETSARPAPETLGDVDDASRARAERVLEEADVDPAPLGNTPFVVTVSDLLRFARSPAELYRARLEPRLDPRAIASFAVEADDPLAGFEHEDPDAERRRMRRDLYDEEHGGDEATLDRTALGRAVHALLERLPPGAAEAPEADLARVLTEEFPAGAPDGARAMLADMVRRFAASPAGTRLAEAPEGAGREVAFHARIRFPRGETVAGFDALLVRGSIDLWLEEEDGLHVVDHKTNAPSAVLPTPEAVGVHYDWQLRLYALAAERIVGRDVADARLLLLDPAWGPQAVEVGVDVSGDALEDARRLCRAYAVAEHEGRWPRDWRALLD